MRQPGNIQDVALLNPDYMGFIFYEPSPRYVGDSFFIPDNFPEGIKKVGVFVNESTANILSRVSQFHLQAVQLHGHESVIQCEELRRFGLEIIKVFSVDEDFDFAVTDSFVNVVDYFLFDTKGKDYGGNGETFNWEILQRYGQQVPYFLSGGINAENIAGIKALYNTNLYAVDVNSGVETAPGMKDVNRIKELTQIN